jgi:hypothetical protein
MIGKVEAMALLREACPSFTGWRDASALDDPEGFARMAELSDLARHVVDAAERGEADELPGVFAAVERVLGDASPAMVSMVRTHFIEDIQNITSHRDVAVAPDAFRSVLGPLALEVWDELDESWRAASTQPGTSPDDRPDVATYLGLDSDERRRLQAMTRELPDGTLARPSDVLRYEAGAYDDQLERRATRRRRYPWVVLGVALLVLAACIIITS